MGTALRRSPPPGVEIFAPGRDRLDLSNLPNDLTSLLDGVTAIVNCGAYTIVDKAESEPELAQAVNAEAPGSLARAAANAEIPIVHVSTDYVFPVNGHGPWREDAPTDPASIYGSTKLAGEGAVRASGARYAIVRTAWVVSVDGNNFIKTMLRLGTQHDILRVVADQRGTLTHAGDLAQVLSTITSRFSNNPALGSGTWHCANSGDTTWHRLATHIFARAAAHGLKVPQEVHAITAADYPTLARRPADSRLDCQLLRGDFGIVLRPWQSAVDEIVATLAQGMTEI